MSDNSSASKLCRRGHDTGVVGKTSSGGCRACRAITGRAHYEANKAEYVERAAQWASKNRDKKQSARRKHERRCYGARAPDGERRSGLCEICGDHSDPLMWDHDHSTGEFRGWLCRACNLLLGYAKDSPERLARAAAYLARCAS